MIQHEHVSRRRSRSRRDRADADARQVHTAAAAKHPRKIESPYRKLAARAGRART